MLLRTLALSAAFITYGAPAIANDFYTVRKSKPRKITSFDFSEREIEMLAVTPRARESVGYGPNAPLAIEHYDPQMPGYPKPAVVSVDLRVSF